jgi:ubiquinone/menaquinone biosynthesis C-methylase UbiE
MHPYERLILPWLQHAVLGLACYVPYRARVVAAATGRVLEVGAGSGYNLRFYGPSAASVAAVEPSPRLRALAARAARRAELPLELHAERAEHLPFPDRSFDSVVMTWVLCSVTEPLAALAELRRVLRPGGMLHFVEHGLAPEPRVQAWQRRLTPLWRRLAGGCRFDRPTLALLREAGFRPRQVQQGYGPGPRVLGYMVEGSASAD